MLTPALIRRTLAWLSTSLFRGMSRDALNTIYVMEVLRGGRASSLSRPSARPAWAQADGGRELRPLAVLSEHAPAVNGKTLQQARDRRCQRERVRSAGGGERRGDTLHKPLDPAPPLPVVSGCGSAEPARGP